MNGKRPAVWLIPLAIAAIAAAGGILYYASRHGGHPSVAPENPGASAAASASSASGASAPATTSPSVAFIYENDRFQGGNPYNDAEFVLYDASTGSSTTIKAFDASFKPVAAAWQWKTPDGAPIILSTIYNDTATTSEIEFFDPRANTVNDTVIVRSPIIDPNASVGVSSAGETVAYCDTEGRFVIFDAQHGATQAFDSLPAPACYTATATQPPRFSRNGTSLYYVAAPLINEGTGTSTPSEVWKLDLATGTDTRSSWIDVSPISRRISPDGTQFADIQYGGLTVRDLVGGPDDPAYDHSSAIDSLRIARDVTLPRGTVVGDVMFTEDGKGVFYYTYTYTTEAGGAEQPGNYELGYYDIAAGENHYPLPQPPGKITYLNLLGGLDEHHLAYETIAIPFTGTSQAGHIIASAGSSSLYLEGVDSGPTLVDTGVAGFSVKSFLLSE